MVKRIILRVKDISCAGCATDIEIVCRNTDGISDTAVDYAAGTLSIEYDPDTISEEQIRHMMGKLGLAIIGQ